MNQKELTEGWAEVVGPSNAPYSYPVGELDGVLYVVTSHPVTETELSRHEPLLSRRAGVRRTHIVADFKLLSDDPYNEVYRHKTRREICREVPDVLHQFVQKHDIYQHSPPSVARQLRQIRRSAKDVFDSSDEAEIWLNQGRFDIPGREGEWTTPIGLLESDAGVDTVRRLLTEVAAKRKDEQGKATASTARSG